MKIFFKKKINVSGNNFSDIKAVIDTATDGDVINLGGKTYTNYTNVYPLSMKKSLYIINGTLDAQNFNFTDLSQGHVLEIVLLKILHYKLLFINCLSCYLVL